MLTIQLWNTGRHPQHPEYGHYEYAVTVNGHIIEGGTVTDHRRLDGWRALLEKLIALDQEEDARVP